jgi:hypothetical protein
MLIVHLDLIEGFVHNGPDSAATCTITLWLKRSSWLLKQSAGPFLLKERERMIHYFRHEINGYFIENKDI